MSNRHLSEKETQFRFGKVIEGEAERDAIHIAVFPAIVSESVSPGEKVKLVDGSQDTVESAKLDENYIGVVDPFLTNWVIAKGSKVYVMLKPNSITGLAHKWTHPDFDDEYVVSKHTKAESEKWLRSFAKEWQFNGGFDELIRAASDEDEDRWVTAMDIDLHSASELGGDHDLFWEHLENFNGMVYSDKHKEGMGWSCSC